jgi:Predicted transcriptional regulator
MDVEYDGSGDQMITALMSTGMKKNTSKVLVFIALNSGTTSENIERAMRLRQPDVSVSVQELYDLGWLGRVSVRGTGKGRPKYVYTLSKPFSEIVDEIEKSEKEKILKIEENLKQMRSGKLFS